NDGTQLNGIFYARTPVRIAGVTDGTSNTLLISELIITPDVTSHDTRGRYWNNARQGSVIFSTLYPPNTAVPDRLQCCSNTLPQAPCTATTTDINLSARSYPPGGVNAGLADGSIRFISNGVNPATYLGLGTRSGGEVAGDF